MHKQRFPCVLKGNNYMKWSCSSEMVKSCLWGWFWHASGPVVPPLGSNSCSVYKQHIILEPSCIGDWATIDLLSTHLPHPFWTQKGWMDNCEFPNDACLFCHLPFALAEPALSFCALVVWFWSNLAAMSGDSWGDLSHVRHARVRGPRIPSLVLLWWREQKVLPTATYWTFETRLFLHRMWVEGRMCLHKVRGYTFCTCSEAPLCWH